MTPSSGTRGVLRDVEVEGRRVDVRVDGGLVTAVEPRLDGPTILDGRGGALLPGLVDHHLHLHALAARDRSVACGPPDVHDAAGLAAALAAALGDEHGWVRAVGYDREVAGDLDTAGLDRLHAARPVRLAHRTGALWTLNSRAAAAVELDDADHPGVERDAAGRPTGRLWRADPWLRARLPTASPPDLAGVGRRLAALGVTAVTDATPDLDTAALRSLATLPVRVRSLGVPLGTDPPSGVTAGPYKILIPDHELPDLDGLSFRIARAHRWGRPVAVHCVTREALVLLLAALDAAGRWNGDRVEHAALVPPELVAELAGLRVVTQPGFLPTRGDDYRRDVPPSEHDDLYRLASLRAADVAVALSSDAPHGPLDPWAVLAAAVTRRTASGAVLGPAERVDAQMALDLLLGPTDDPGGRPRRVRPGTPADLVLLHPPLTEALRHPDSTAVRATLIDGDVVHGDR